ncbi:hypothetical protein AX17_002018 [Amanita inopinata Kibby_2008]|nr:hypothetical protein AX17_002018 [Amanita inopinata Kibby_2008]
MASYFRSLFGSSGNRNKSHSRSSSAGAIPAQSLGHIYVQNGTVPPAAIPNARERTNSNVAAQAIHPSPLRYTTDDPGSLRGKQRSSSSQHATYPSYSRHHRGDSHSHYAQPSFYQQTPPRSLYRSSSHKEPERPPLYPLYTPTGSFSSVHSTSSSASKQYSSSCQRPAPPRTASSGSVPISESRIEPKPVLKREHTSSGSSTKSTNRAHVSFLNPNKPPTLHMHPLLAYSRLHRPPICYDITYAPSSCTVLDRSTLNPVPPHTLTQPATEPLTYTRLVLRSDKLPWPVFVTSPSEGGGKNKFYIGGGSSHSRQNSAVAITNLDILYALHHTLSVRVTQSEWEALGRGSRVQRKATRAYEKRCQKMGGGWEGGVRRLDYLGRKMVLVGIELDKTSNDCGGTGKLVFGKM